jgi:hypothetical protein
MQHAAVQDLDPAMRDLLLYASGTLGLALAFLHGLLGETRVFARARIEPERLRRLVWHCSAVAWAGVAVLLRVLMLIGFCPGRFLGRSRFRASCKCGRRDWPER